MARGDVTDAEWALIEPFVPVGGRGPVSAGRRGAVKRGGGGGFRGEARGGAPPRPPRPGAPRARPAGGGAGAGPPRWGARGAGWAARSTWPAAGGVGPWRSC